VTIEERWRDLVHTHFVTDGERMKKSDHDALRRSLEAWLREERIVYGVRLLEPLPKRPAPRRVRLE